MPQMNDLRKMEEPNSEPQIEPTSAEVVAGNEDLSAEILIRLSANSLARCLWVSKLWLSFICNPTFVLRHTLICPPSLSGLFLIPRQTSQSPKVHYVSLNHSKPNFALASFLNFRGFRILNSCNGLLLCHLEQSYYVCNPTMRQFRVLPSCSYIERKFELNLAFDLVNSPSNYKVICVQKLDAQPGLYRIAIYSSSTCLWNLKQELVSAPEDIDFMDGVFCNGAVHWLKSTQSGVYLDLVSEMLREMPQLPRRADQSQYNFKYFGKSQRYLFYVISRPLLNYYELYQLKEDYSGWDLKFRVNLNTFTTRFPAIARNFRLHPLFSEYECDVLCINHAESEDDMEVVLSIPGEVIVLNLRKNTLIAIRDPVFRPCDVTVWYKIYSVFESFETVSLV